MVLNGFAMIPIGSEIAVPVHMSPISRASIFMTYAYSYGFFIIDQYTKKRALSKRKFYDKVIVIL